MEIIEDRYKNFIQALQLFNSKKNIRKDLHKNFTNISSIGSTNLLLYKYFSIDKPTILIIASLINKFYILDLSAEKSLIENLYKQNNNIFVIEWQNPIKEEYEFGLEEYIFSRIIPIIERIFAICSKKFILLGYCLGGTISLILSELVREKISGLILIATPWDFSRLTYLSAIEPSSSANLIFPTYLKLFFWNLDYNQIIEKFNKFYHSEIHSEFYQDFLLIENWLDDGIIVTANLINDIINLHNKKSEKFGKIKDILSKNISDSFSIPKLVIINQNDKIVPCESSIIIAETIHTEIKFIDSGHIALFVKKHLTDKLSYFIYNWQQENVINQILAE